MLDVAIRHEAELVDLFRSVWFKDRYKYWTCSNFNEDYKVNTSTWVNHEFVSIRNGRVIGYIGYSIDRADLDSAYALNIINFEERPSVTFARDLGNALTDIFEKYKLRKLSFSVVIGNPIEKSYDKMCNMYGGRIVGVKKKHVRLIDGELYDEKLYEVLREDYERRKLNVRKAV